MQNIKDINDDQIEYTIKIKNKKNWTLNIKHSGNMSYKEFLVAAEMCIKDALTDEFGPDYDSELVIFESEIH